MASFTTIVNYPDNKQAELLAALRYKYGQILDQGVYRDRTPAECKAALENDIKKFIEGIYLTHKKYLKSLEGSQDDLGATV